MIDELREGADCLREGVEKLERAVEESGVDGDIEMMEKIRSMVRPMREAGVCLEESGKAVLQKESVGNVGDHFVSCGEALEMLALALKTLDEESEPGQMASQRMMYASQQIQLAGKELRGDKKEKATGKAWLKG